MNDKDTKWDEIQTITAIILIGGLEAMALYTGADGKFLLPVVAIISGLGGYKINDLFTKVGIKK